MISWNDSDVGCVVERGQRALQLKHNSEVHGFSSSAAPRHCAFIRFEMTKVFSGRMAWSSAVLSSVPPAVADPFCPSEGGGKILGFDYWCLENFGPRRGPGRKARRVLAWPEDRGRSALFGPLERLSGVSGFDVCGRLGRRGHT